MHVVTYLRHGYCAADTLRRYCRCLYYDESYTSYVTRYYGLRRHITQHIDAATDDMMLSFAMLHVYLLLRDAAFDSATATARWDATCSLFTDANTPFPPLPSLIRHSHYATLFSVSTPDVNTLIAPTKMPPFFAYG